MSFLVRIFLMQRGCDVWMWLCARCRAEKEAEGWNIRQSKDPPHELRCEGDAYKAARENVRRAA